MYTFLLGVLLGVVTGMFAVAACRRMHNLAILDERQKHKEMEQLEAQRQFFQASKMAALTTMMSGIAHELNNPLTTILGFSTILRREIPHTNEKIERHIDLIIKSAKRMGTIIEQLSKFGHARAAEYGKGPVNVNDVIRNSLILLRPQLKGCDITLDLNLDNKIFPIKGDSAKLENVFENLIVNAKDAFENVKDHRAKKLNIITENAPDHKSVQIIFKDNASGIASEYVEKIFDPFFTTKCPNRGTGLGMTLSYEWVKEHNGTISCSSAGPGEGTTFFISLPTTIA